VLIFHIGGAMADVIVVGGGVIGLSIAWELAEQGMSVRLLEQGAIGQEASWAGAGMLPPGNPAGAKTPEARLRAASHQLWPNWSGRLREVTGIDNGYLRCGGLHVSTTEHDAAYVKNLADWQAEGATVESVTDAACRERWPWLGPAVCQTFLLPEMGQIRNPRHLKSLEAACGLRGVELHSGLPVVEINRQGDRIRALRTPQGTFEADEFVFAAGAWSARLLQLADVTLPVEPVRGQIVLLESRPLPFRTIIEQGRRYLVPRPDGKILIGSTEERVGFLKANTATVIAELIQFAVNLVPALATARFDRAWSGLRPFRAGELPDLGRIPGLRNACVATGHFRSGLQMSPITAVLIRQVLLGQPVDLPRECRASA